MAVVSIEDGVLTITLTVPERVLSLHNGDVQIPVEQISGITPVADVMAQVRGLRMPGARVPGVLAIGSWRGRDRSRPFHDFVLVHHPGPGVVITTNGGGYDRVLLGAEEPQRYIEELFG